MTKQELLDFIDATGVVRVKDLALKFHLWDPEARADLHPLLNQRIVRRARDRMATARQRTVLLPRPSRLSEGDEEKFVKN